MCFEEIVYKYLLFCIFAAEFVRLGEFIWRQNSVVSLCFRFFLGRGDFFKK